jgi:hypothetical protein
MGDRPLELCVDEVTLIERWLPPEDNRDADAAVGSGDGLCPLGSVRTLQVTIRSRTVCTPTTVARVLRAAPHLESLIVFVFAPEVEDVDSLWWAHPAFDGLVHLKLKRIHIPGWSLRTPLSSDSFPRLRQRHLPRLKELAIDGRQYFITPLESPSFAKSLVTRFLKFAAGLVSWL